MTRLQIELKVINIVRAILCVCLSMNSSSDVFPLVHLNIDGEWRFSLSLLMTHRVRVVRAKEPTFVFHLPLNPYNATRTNGYRY
jgi:hypothetical protein